MKYLKYILAIVLGFIVTGSVAYGATVLFVPQGGTGASTFSSSQLLYGHGTGAVQTVATTSVTCSGSTSCTGFTAIGGSPITISSVATGSGLSTSSPLSGGNLLVYSSGGAGSAFGVATTTLAGTGVLSVTNSPVVLGGTPSVVSITGGAGGQVLAWANGVPTWVATSSINNGVTSIQQLGGGTAQTGAITLATSTTAFNGLSSLLNITNTAGAFTFNTTLSGTLGVAGGGTGAGTLTGCLTGNGTGAITGSGTCATLTGGLLPLAQGGTNASLSGANQVIFMNSANTALSNESTFTYLATNSQDLLTLANASTTALTVGNYGNFAGKLGVGSTTPAFPFSVQTVGSEFYITSTGEVVGRDQTNAWTGRISPTHNLALATGTTTTWTASSTGAYSPFVVAPFAGTIQDIRCLTDAGFLGVNVQIAGSSLTPAYLVASTTVGKVAYTASNTFTIGQKISMDVGTTTTSVAKTISCTLDVTETP